MITYNTIPTLAHYGSGAQLTFTFGQDTPLVDNQDDFDDNIYPYMDSLNAYDENSWQRGHIMARSLGGEATLRNFFPVAREANLKMEEIEKKVKYVCNELTQLKERFCRQITIPDSPDYATHPEWVHFLLCYDVSVSRQTNIVNGVAVPANFRCRVYFKYRFQNETQETVISNANYANNLRLALSYEQYSRYQYNDIVIDSIIVNRNDQQ